jgi:hypothetical protein
MPCTCRITLQAANCKKFKVILLDGEIRKKSQTDSVVFLTRHRLNFPVQLDKEQYQAMYHYSTTIIPLLMVT